MGSDGSDSGETDEGGTSCEDTDGVVGLEEVVDDLVVDGDRASGDGLLAAVDGLDDEGLTGEIGKDIDGGDANSGDNDSFFLSDMSDVSLELYRCQDAIKERTEQHKTGDHA